MTTVEIGWGVWKMLYHPHRQAKHAQLVPCIMPLGLVVERLAVKRLDLPDHKITLLAWLAVHELLHLREVD